jgi:hypothetical protein
MSQSQTGSSANYAYSSTGYSTRGDKLARTLAGATGAVFLLVGVLGFVPGITTHYGSMTFAGHESGAELLGIFGVSVLHNIVHLLFGVAGLALARNARTAVTFLIGGGVVYLLLWVYGMVIDQTSNANFVPLDDADNWLHLVLGLAMVVMGLVAQRALRDTTDNATLR